MTLTDEQGTREHDWQALQSGLKPPILLAPPPEESVGVGAAHRPLKICAPVDGSGRQDDRTTGRTGHKRTTIISSLDV